MLTHKVTHYTRFCTCTYDYMQVDLCMSMSAYMYPSTNTFCLHTKTYAYIYIYIYIYISLYRYMLCCTIACPLCLHYVTCLCHTSTHAICLKILHKYHTYLNTYKFICTLSYKLNHAITIYIIVIMRYETSICLYIYIYIPILMHVMLNNSMPVMTTLCYM